MGKGKMLFVLFLATVMAVGTNSGYVFADSSHGNLAEMQIFHPVGAAATAEEAKFEELDSSDLVSESVRDEESLVGGDTTSYDGYYFYSKLTDNGKSAYRAFMEDAETPTVYGGTVNTAGKVSVSGGVTYSEAQTALDAVHLDHPELFWIGQGFSGFSYSSGNIALLYFSNYADPANYDTMKKSFDAGAAEILSQVDLTAPPAIVAMKLHDQLIDYMNYDFAAANDSSYQDGIATVNMLAHTAYGAFVSKSGVCEAYSRAYEYLLQQAGIPCAIVQSEQHAWNIVELSGEWYEVDCTWDDLNPVKKADGLWYLQTGVDTYANTTGLDDATLLAFEKQNGYKYFYVTTAYLVQDSKDNPITFSDGSKYELMHVRDSSPTNELIPVALGTHFTMDYLSACGTALEAGKDPEGKTLALALWNGVTADPLDSDPCATSWKVKICTTDGTSRVPDSLVWTATAELPADSKLTPASGTWSKTESVLSFSSINQKTEKDTAVIPVTKVVFDNGTYSSVSGAITRLSYTQPAGLGFSPAIISVGAGERKSLKTVSVNDQNKVTAYTSLSSSNSAVASVSEEGVISGISEGETVITAVLKADPTKTASCRVLVTRPAGTLKLDSESLFIKKGSTKQFSIQKNGTAVSSINFSCLDSGVAGIDSDGTLTALKCGRSFITADDDANTAVCTLTVYTRGDMDLSDAVDVVDLQNEAKQIVGLISFSTEEKTIGDMSGDGNIDVEDLQTIAKVIVHLEE